MQRNHQATALLRACRQVPDWWTVGGRRNPYAIEFVGLGTTSQFYSKAGTYTGDETITMWIRPTATITNGVDYGLFSIYDSGLGQDIWTLELQGDTTNGNTLELFLQGVSQGKVLNIGTTWSNITLSFAGGLPSVYHNGTLSFTALSAYVAPADTHTIGISQKPAPAVSAHLSEVVIDEVAFFDAFVDPAVLYNSGVPLDYGDDYASLIASYEVEKPIGAINANTLGPTYHPSGTTPASFVFGGSTTGVVEITTDALRSSDTNSFKEMCTNYGDYVRGTAVGGATPLGTGVDLPDVACGLMPYPAGAGWSTLGYTGAFVGNHEEPQATPEASKATTMVSDDSTDYAAVGGTASLGGVVDARAGRLFLPLFVKR